MRHTRTAIVTFLTTIILLAGCASKQRQAEKHDQQIRQQVEQLKKKSRAYPVNGSNANHYIP